VPDDFVNAHFSLFEPVVKPSARFRKVRARAAHRSRGRGARLLGGRDSEFAQNVSGTVEAEVLAPFCMMAIKAAMIDQ